MSTGHFILYRRSIQQATITTHRYSFPAGRHKQAGTDTVLQSTNSQNADNLNAPVECEISLTSCMEAIHHFRGPIGAASRAQGLGRFARCRQWQLERHVVNKREQECVPGVVPLMRQHLGQQKDALHGGERNEILNTFRGQRRDCFMVSTFRKSLSGLYRVRIGKRAPSESCPTRAVKPSTR